MSTIVQVPVSLGGTDTPYNDGTGAYGMAGQNGYGYSQYFFPMLSEVMAACALAIQSNAGSLQAVQQLADGVTQNSLAAAAAAASSQALFNRIYLGAY